MILTGNEIEKAIKAGEIEIDSFSKECLNPNSYNYHLGETLIELSPCAEGITVESKEVSLSDDGFILWPGRLYLGNTLEKIGSKKFAMSLIGRSSLGRLGLFLQVSANLGHTGSFHKWTLELVATMPIKIYPRMRIGQISFWSNQGSFTEKKHTYANFNVPTLSFLKPEIIRIFK